MGKVFYTVIVGTEPGIYEDWYLPASRFTVYFGGGVKANCNRRRTQAALRVIEITGAIYKKYKTYPEALEAFKNAERDGKVRAIQVDPEPEPEVDQEPEPEVDGEPEPEAESPHGFQVREQTLHEYPEVRPIPIARQPSDADTLSQSDGRNLVDALISALQAYHDQITQSNSDTTIDAATPKDNLTRASTGL
jgi:Caulimovirus viroplasmin